MVNDENLLTTQSGLTRCPTGRCVEPDRRPQDGILRHVRGLPWNDKTGIWKGRPSATHCSEARNVTCNHIVFQIIGPLRCADDHNKHKHSVQLLTCVFKVACLLDFGPGFVPTSCAQRAHNSTAILGVTACASFMLPHSTTNFCARCDLSWALCVVQGIRRLHCSAHHVTVLWWSRQAHARERVALSMDTLCTKRCTRGFFGGSLSDCCDSTLFRCPHT